MMQKFSIAIPTFNRSKLLLETMEALRQQSEDLKFNIADNSDDFQTQESLSSSEFDYKYHHNGGNKGIDFNILKAVSLADSEYVWICGDDDLPESDAINKIVDYVCRYPEVAFFIVNSSAYDSTLTNVVFENQTGIKDDIYFDDATTALETIGWYSTFVGAFVVKKAVWDQTDSDRFLDTWFIHVGKLFDAMAQGHKAYFIAEPLIRYRTGNTTWGDLYLQIQFEFWPASMKLLPSSYSKQTKLKAVKSVSGRFVSVPALFLARSRGALNFQTFKKYILPFGLDEFEGYRLKFLFSSALFLLVPPVLAKKVFEWREKLR